MNRILQYISKNGIFYVLALLIAIGLKYHYSRASSEDLDWILRPTAGIVEQMTGLHFEKEEGTGYINKEHYIIIAPSCAGVNFLIMAFCMTLFSFICCFNAPKIKLLWLCGSLVSAYLLALVVNAVRIIVAMSLYQADIYSGWLTEDRLHHLEGIVVYFFFLCAYYVILRKLIYRMVALPQRGVQISPLPWSKLPDKHRHFIYAGLIPFFWYILLTLFVPLINRAYQGNVPRFLEHWGFVLTGCMAVLLFIVLIQLGWDRIMGKK